MRRSVLRRDRDDLLGNPQQWTREKEALMRTRESKTRFTFGFCLSGNHQHCRGALARPGGAEAVLCSCRCHAGQEIELPARPIDARAERPVVVGKRDRKLLEAWGAALRRDGVLEVEAPADEAALASARRRLHSAARKQGVAVKLTVRDGKITARCR